MEPPGEGRYEARAALEKKNREAQPQWSRPVKGGTSALAIAAAEAAQAAAMEPPGEGRYELHHRPEGLGRR